MDVKLGAGLLFEDFLNPNELVKRKTLKETGLIGFVQITPGKKFFSLPTKEIDQITEHMISFFDETQLKLLVHLPGENVGVDPGESLDWRGAFKEHNKNNNISWSEFNEQNISLCLNVAKKLEGRKALVSPLRVIHPGYGKNTDDTASFSRIVSLLSERNNIALETLPALITEGVETPPIWGFGGIPDSMKNLISKLANASPLLDFTHINVTSNVIATGKFSSFFPQKHKNQTSEEAYKQLLEDFNALKPCNVLHIGGYTTSNMDNNYSFGNEPGWFVDTTNKAIKGISNPLIALEIDYSDTKKAEAQISHFKDHFL